MANIVELIIRTVDQSSGPLGNVARGLVNVRTVAAGVGAAISAVKLKDFLVSSFQAADQLSDAAKRANVAIETFSRLAYVAEQNDIEFGEFTNSLKFTNKAISDLAAGAKGPAKDAFDFLQISAKQLQGLSIDKQLGIIADQFRRIRDPADQTRTAIDLFGRSGTALIPLLNQGSAGIKDLTAEADRLGITMSGQSAAGVDALDSAIKKLKNTISGFGKRIVGNLALATVGTDDPLIELERRAKFINMRINSIYQSASGGPLGAGARKDVEALNAELGETERQILRLQAAAAKAPEGGFLPPRKKEREEYKAFFKEINPQVLLAFQQSGDFLSKMTEAREATMTTAQKAGAEWAKFNEQIKEAGISAEDAAVRTKEKLDEMLQEIDVNDLKRLRLAEPLTEAQKRAKAFTDTLKEGLENAAERGKFSVKELVRFIIAQLVKQELFKAIDNIGAAISKALSPQSVSGGGGGLFASALNFGASYFGFRAGGGRFSGLTMVGENGPELVGGSGRVWNNQQLQHAMRGGSGGTLNYNPISQVTINGAGGDSRDTALLVDARIRQNNNKQMQEMQRMLERNGFGRMR